MTKDMLPVATGSQLVQPGNGITAAFFAYVCLTDAASAAAWLSTLSKRLSEAKALEQSNRQQVCWPSGVQQGGLNGLMQQHISVDASSTSLA